MDNDADSQQTDVQLLSAVIGVSGTMAKPAAHQLLERFGSLRALLHADAHELLACQGIG
ncbi:MAG: hypothetical protein HKN64_04385, partial [Woeseiaceae bacterium]|nr:hypothetical protein [Woeseiaceae bacterium]